MTLIKQNILKIYMINCRIYRNRSHCSVVSCDVLCQDPGHSHDRDSHVLDVMTRVIETSYEDIPVSGGNTVRAGAKRLLPGWRENVAPAKDDSLFWCSEMYHGSCGKQFKIFLPL